MDVWSAAVQLTQMANESPNATGAHAANPKSQTRASLQVLELVRIPYIKVDYRYGDQDYTFFTYDVEGKEKFYADPYPARWDRIERLVRFISTDLMSPSQEIFESNGAVDQMR